MQFFNEIALENKNKSHKKAFLLYNFRKQQQNPILHNEKSIKKFIATEKRAFSLVHNTESKGTFNCYFEKTTTNIKKL